MRDDIETNVNFIEIVRLNPCLYDQSRSDYNNRKKQDEVWSKIALQLNETVTTCRDRWKNIRGRYVKQINKQTPGSTSKPKTPYYLADHLHFLDAFIKSRPPYKKNNLLTEIDSAIPDEQSNSIPDISDDDSLRQDPLEANQVLTDSAPSTPEPSAEFSPTKYYKINKQNAISQKLKRKQSAFTELDPDEAFLKSVLPDIKNMTEIQKRNFKVAVLRIAGDILNQPVVTPPSILTPHVTKQTDSSSTNSNQSVTTPSCVEGREQGIYWNEASLAPRYAVVSEGVDVVSTDSNHMIFKEEY